MDSRLNIQIGPIILTTIDDVFDVVQKLPTTFQKIEFLKERAKEYKIEEAFKKFKFKAPYTNIPYYWLGVYFSKNGDYNIPPLPTEEAIDTFYYGKRGWNEFCLINQWIDDLEKGKKIQYSSHEDNELSNRELLRKYHKLNGGRLTNDQISGLASIKNNEGQTRSIKNMQNIYRDMLDDIS